MIDQIINKYLETKYQIIEFDKNGTILSSNNCFFSVSKSKKIYDLHPFFEIINDLLIENEIETIFKTILIQIKSTDIISDVVVYSGNTNQNPFVILFDKTDYYTEIQEITQNKNELFISNYFQNEKNLKLTDEQSFKNKFFASISHDLKTPITGALGLLELFKKENLTYEQKELLHTISNSMIHMNRLVSDVFDLSKIEFGELKIINNPFDLDSMIKNIEHVYLEKFILKNIEFKIIKAANVPTKLIGDYNRVAQIFINLLDNAHKYTNEGKVTVEIKLDYRRAKNVWLKFCFSDTGIGFDSKIKKFESFRKFNNLNFEGAGLGLSIVSNLIELMKGSMKFESEIGNGSRFEITLPFEAKIQSKIIKSKKPDFEKLIIKNKFNVLIVDDNEINQLVLMKLLVNHGGFYMDVAVDGCKALELMDKEKYDLIFMDLYMPNKNGFETIEIIKKNPKHKEIKIIALSSNDLENDIQKGKNLEIDDFISKPFTSKDLYSSIYKVLELKN